MGGQNAADLLELVGNSSLIGSERILTISHGHPRFTVGGGEVAAYQLHGAYSEHPRTGEAFFLARHNGEQANGAIRLLSEREYLWEQGMTDFFFLRAANRESTLGPFRDLVKLLNPTIIHFHHYIHLGVEALRVARQVMPDAVLLMTLHEMIAICFNNGQMVKKHSMQLCEQESLDDCRLCFPDISRESFWLRKRFLHSHFTFVDQFVVPSVFLKERYIAWGLPADRISVIENGQNAFAPAPPRPIGEGRGRNRFGFFGQINPFKGVDVLLEALSSMKADQRAQLEIEVHGSNLEMQPEEFKERIERLRGPLLEDGCLRWIGPYRRSELPNRLRGVDWILVPSIWWENSPMIIQEAFTYGRPVICSGIGGMAEKVHHGIDGLHVNGGVFAWAHTLLSAANDVALWEKLRGQITRPLTRNDCGIKHFDAVDAIRRSRQKR